MTEQYQFTNHMQEYQITKGHISFKMPVVSHKCKTEIKDSLMLLFKDNIRISTQANITYIQESQISTQEYKIIIEDNHIQIYYQDIAGAIYGSITLKHMIEECKGNIPNGIFIDKPQFLVRGLLYDISRNKVPKLETLYRLVDIMWELKYNQLQLYVEGLSYEYTNYQEVLEKECYITKKEIKSLVNYCKERQIDLVPNQNTLGHMAGWLEKEPFKELRKNPNGEFAFGRQQPCATLDNNNPKSKTFIENITQDLLEPFESAYYNVNLDEVFGMENEKEYIDWTNYLKDLVESKDKKMLMWSDMINTYPKLANSLSKEAVLLDWGYEDNYPFDRECQLLQEKGFEFYVCPGTSSWSSIAGRTRNMIDNMNNAISTGIKYGAAGVINTDWGDDGHRQTFPISFPGIVGSGLTSWSGKTLKTEDIASYLNRYIYLDPTNQMGNLVIKLGNSYLLDEIILINGSFLHHQFQMGLCSSAERETYIQKMLEWMIPYAERFEEYGDKETIQRLKNRTPNSWEKQRTYIEEISKAIKKITLNCIDGELIKAEYELTILMLEISLDMTEYIEGEENVRNKKIQLNNMKSKNTILIAKFKEIWHDRNKESHIATSMECFIKLQEVIATKLQED